MFPVLDALRAHYGRVLAVEFIDVWKTPERARPFGVRVIPTQVFLDPQGREVFRHEGFFTEAAVIAAFGRAGIALEAEAHTP
jgi:thioredoxin 1